MAKKLITNGVDSSVLVKNLNSELLNNFNSDDLIGTPIPHTNNTYIGYEITLKELDMTVHHLIYFKIEGYGRWMSPVYVLGSFYYYRNDQSLLNTNINNVSGTFIDKAYVYIKDDIFKIYLHKSQTIDLNLRINVYDEKDHKCLIENIKDIKTEEDIPDFGDTFKEMSLKYSAENNTGKAFDHVDLPASVSKLDLNTLPPIANVNTIILRYNGVVKDLDTYVDKSETTPVIPLHMSDEVSVSADIPSTLELQSSIAPMVNLDEYVRTPNNWLKIYVPNAQLENYKNTYPSLTLYLYAINDKSPYNFSVGGTNLLRHTKDYKTYSIVESELIENDYRGLTALHCKNLTKAQTLVNLIPNDNVLLDENEIYTFSFYAKGTYIVTAINITNIEVSSIIRCSGGISTVPNAWHKQNLTSEYERYFVTFKTGTGGKGNVRIQIVEDPSHEVYICGAKLEKGTVPTDWSPAPDDIDEQFEEIDNTFAKKDGAYEGLLAGTAMNLQGQQDVVISSMYQPTGGHLDVNWDTAEVQNIKGNAIAWNQMMPDDYNHIVIGDSTAFTFQYDENREVKVQTINLDSISIVHSNINYIKMLEDRKYYVRTTVKLNKSRIFNIFNKKYDFVENEPIVCSAIIENNSRVNFFDNPQFKELDDEIVLKDIQIIDLTILYGVDNEPTTPEQFEDDYQKWFGKTFTFEEYDKGTIKTVFATELKTVGFNLSPITDFSGTLDRWGTENYNLWKNNCNYKGQIQITADYKVTFNDDRDDIEEYIMNIQFRDGSYEWVRINKNRSKLNWRTPQNKVIDEINATWSYNGEFRELEISNLCIHFVWSGSRNDEYEPYWEETKNLPLTSLTGKLNGEGESVVIFPNGMKRARNAYDEIYVEDGVTKAIKRVGTLDLGTLRYRLREDPNPETAPNIHKYFNNTEYDIFAVPLTTGIIANLITPHYASYINSGWNARRDKTISVNYQGQICISDNSYSDEESFKESLQGQIIYYELPTPEVYILDDFQLPLTYRIDDFGTEQIIALNNTITPILTTRYGVNAVDTLRRLPQNYISERSINNLLYQLNSVMNGTWSKSWNDLTNSYDFSFVHNEVPDSSLPNEELP